jgi:hypothetical protein
MISYIAITQIPKWFGHPLPNAVIITLMLLHIPVAIIYAIRRLHKGDDGKMLANWQRKENKRVQKQKDERNKQMILTSRQGYSISNIFSLRDKACSFRIVLTSHIIDNILPEISIGNVKASVQRIQGSSNEVICHAEHCISSSDNQLVFNCGTSSYKITNPYKYTPSGQTFKWQCEGHAEEKKIFIPQDCFPNIDHDAVYSFVLLIDGKIKATIDGTYDAMLGAVVLPISQIKKDLCVGHRCEIKNIFGKSNIITLPHPKVFVRNGVPA